MSFWKYNKLRGCEEGEIEYKLSEELCEFRLLFAAICSNLLLVPFFAGFLSYCSRQLGWEYVIGAMAATAVTLLIPVLFRKVKAGYEREGWEYAARQNQILVQVSENAKIIKTWSLQKYFIQKWHAQYEEYFRKFGKKANRVKTLSYDSNEFIKLVSQLMVLVLGCVLVQKNSITTGSIVIMLQYLVIFETFMGKCAQVITNLPQMKKKAQRLGFFYDSLERCGGEKLCDGLENVQCQNLTYRYGDKTIINRLSFEIKRGEKVRITGGNGSGKSTLLRILCGLDEDYEGDILINGVSLKNVNLPSWRDKIAIAFQEDTIFPGTVEENIAMGLRGEMVRGGNAEEAINEVAALLGLTELLDKKISYGADELSGGEKKKIAIARALLKGSGLLCVDEGDNHLDTKTRENLYRYIKNTEQTVIYISHDLAYGELAERVVEL